MVDPSVFRFASCLSDFIGTRALGRITSQLRYSFPADALCSIEFFEC